MDDVFDDVSEPLPDDYRVEIVSELYYKVDRDEIEATADDFQDTVNEYVESLDRLLGVEYANVTIDHVSAGSYRVLREAMVHYRESS